MALPSSRTQILSHVSPSPILPHPAVIDDEKERLKSIVLAKATSSSTSAVLHRSLHQDPLRVVGARGNYLELSNGQRILDATVGAAVACLGHGNERVKAAIARQLDEAAYCHSLFYSVTAAEDLARELVDSTGGKLSRAFIVSSGSEAMEAAMKLARQYFVECAVPQYGRTKFIARTESYHGSTLGALSLGGHRARRALFEPILTSNVSWVSPCNEYRGMSEGTVADYVAKLAKELDDEFIRQGSDTVCAFVAEPVVGVALGCVPSVPGYLQAMKSVCEKHGALLILDEVMCGMGRTGTLHAWEQENVVPDIQTIGKGLGGGYVPVAGVLIGHRVVDALTKGSGSFSHGQTYQGHPIACAAALEVQRVIKKERLLANVKTMGDRLSSLLKEKLGTHPHVGDIRGRGLFWGIEFVQERGTRKPFNPKQAIAMAIHEKGMASPYNISLYPGTGSVDGKQGDHILVAPAYNVTDADIEEIVRRTVAVIEDFFPAMTVGEQ